MTDQPTPPAPKATPPSEKADAIEIHEQRLDALKGGARFNLDRKGRDRDSAATRGGKSMNNESYPAISAVELLKFLVGRNDYLHAAQVRDAIAIYDRRFQTDQPAPMSLITVCEAVQDLRAQLAAAEANAAKFEKAFEDRGRWLTSEASRRKEAEAQVAALKAALTKIANEHRHQSEVWLTECGDIDNSEYHKKWSDVATAALAGVSAKPCTPAKPEET